jgi:tetratricopeptide (TPR) repeat protein
MRPAPWLLALCAGLTLVGCAIGARPLIGLRPVSNAPVLADLSTSESLVKGRSYLAMKQYGLAIELFKKASRDPASEAEAYNGLAISYEAIGRPDLAERYFEQAMSLAPEQPRYVANLQRFYAGSGQKEKERRLIADIAASKLDPGVREPVDPSMPDRLALNGGEPQAARSTTTEATALTQQIELASGTVLNDESTVPLPLALAWVQLRLDNRPVEQANALECFLRQASTVACDWLSAGNGGEPNIVGGAFLTRLSLGEVFLVTAPTAGRAPISTATFQRPEPMSNRAYLGLVAAALQRQNDLEAAMQHGGAVETANWSNKPRFAFRTTLLGSRR